MSTLKQRCIIAASGYFLTECVDLNATKFQPLLHAVIKKTATESYEDWPVEDVACEIYDLANIIQDAVKAELKLSAKVSNRMKLHKSVPATTKAIRSYIEHHRSDVRTHLQNLMLSDGDKRPRNIRVRIRFDIWWALGKDVRLELLSESRLAEDGVTLDHIDTLLRKALTDADICALVQGKRGESPLQGTLEAGDNK